MPVSLNSRGYSNAMSLIARGEIDDSSDWSWTTEDENDLLGDPPDWERFASFHLGRDEDADPETKAAWKYPFGKDGTVFISALNAIRRRAAQNDATEIFDAAGRLLVRAKERIELKHVCRVEARGESSVIFLYGDIGWEIGASNVASLLDKTKGSVIVRLSSYGGDLAEALAIYELLKSRDVEIVIDGIAASAASVIAMAGKRVLMAEHAMMMIHGPRTSAAGRSKDLRETADLLDRLAERMEEIYARRAPKHREKIASWLRDGEDHWLSAAEAIELGLADGLSTVKEENVEMEETPAPTSNVERVAARLEPDAPAKASAEVIELNRLAERNRCIIAVFEPFRETPGVVDVERNALADPTVDEGAARAMLLEVLARGQKPTAAFVSVTADEGEKLFKGLTGWLLAKCVMSETVAKAGLVENKRDLEPGEFRGLSLADIAGEILDRAGVKTRGMSKTEIVARAMSMPPKVFAASGQTTSDFAILLENVLHKTLLASYRVQRVTWPQWASRTTVSDFRVHTRYRVSSLAHLPKLNEAGVLSYIAIPDGEKVTVKVDERGYRCGLPRQAIVNDDLGAFTDIVRQLGQAARRSEEVEAISVLVSNPTMADGNPMFSTAHGNVGTGGPPSVATFDEVRRLMASQKDPAGNDYLDLRPAIWLGPVGLDGEAMVVNDSQYDPDAANKLQRPNKVRGLFSTIIGTPRLTGTAWYALADPAEAPAFEVAFLASEPEPRIEQMAPWETLGLEWRIVHTFGVAAVDWRAAVRNPGA